MTGIAALAVDLGGTELRAAIVDAEGTLRAFAATPTDARGGPDAVIGQIVSLADRVQAEAPGFHLKGMGIGAPGPLDPFTGVVINPPTLAGWRDVPLGRLLHERFGLPVRMENDANAAALGEWRFGTGKGRDSVVFVTVSTGIGGGVVSEGRLLHGRKGLAAEIGHMTVTDTGEPCFCGVRGCWEAVASGTALGVRASRATSPGDGSALRRASGDGPVSARHVEEAARQGDGQAIALLADEARWLGIGFVNLLHLYSPEVIVVGGGLAHGLDLMRPTIEETILARAMPPYRDVPVVPASLGRHAGLVGAASSVLFDGNETSSEPARRR